MVPLLTLRAYRRESFIKHEKQQRSAQQPGPIVSRCARFSGQEKAVYYVCSTMYQRPD
jgi:hypothetical protein